MSVSKDGSGRIGRYFQLLNPTHQQLKKKRESLEEKVNILWSKKMKEEDKTSRIIKLKHLGIM